MLCAVALFAGVTLILSRPAPDTTEFYVLGKAQLAEDYPRRANVGENIIVTSGIANRTHASQTYRVEVLTRQNSDQDWTTLATIDDLVLQPGTQLEQPLIWRMPYAGDEQPVEVRLFRKGDSEIYRTLRLWIDVTPLRR
jgi:uncharacterized membrane protein